MAAAEIDDQTINCADYLLECPGDKTELKLTSLKAMFNSIPLHAMPVSVNIMNNAILKYHSSEEKSITTINHPFERYLQFTYFLATIDWVMKY